MKTAVLWPFKFTNFIPTEIEESWSWEPRMQWLCEALHSLGFTILKHKDFHCRLENYEEYSGQKECDVLIFNHCDHLEMPHTGIHAKQTWFFKPTVPDANQTTLDEMGYGSYSSITYEKPNYENFSSGLVNLFFNERVSKWINNNSCKWGDNHFKEFNKLFRLGDEY